MSGPQPGTPTPWDALVAERDALPPCPDGMKRLIELTFAVDQDGDDFHVRNSTRIPDGVTWAEAFHGTTQIADDLTRQIAERFNCPWHPKNVKETGEPSFVERDALQARVDAPFDAIKHGDQDHQDWLRNAISDHFKPQGNQS